MVMVWNIASPLVHGLLEQTIDPKGPSKCLKTGRRMFQDGRNVARVPGRKVFRLIGTLIRMTSWKTFGPKLVQKLTNNPD